MQTVMVRTNTASTMLSNILDWFRSDLPDATGRIDSHHQWKSLANVSVSFPFFHLSCSTRTRGLLFPDSPFHAIFPCSLHLTPPLQPRLHTLLFLLEDVSNTTYLPSLSHRSYCLSSHVKTSSGSSLLSLCLFSPVLLSSQIMLTRSPSLLLLPPNHLSRPPRALLPLPFIPLR